MYCATQGYTQTGIPLVCDPSVYWKMVTYQNVTPDLRQLPPKKMKTINEVSMRFVFADTGGLAVYSHGDRPVPALPLLSCYNRRHDRYFNQCTAHIRVRRSGRR